MYLSLFLAQKETSNRNLLGYWERVGDLFVRELQFLHKKKKSERFNDKKSLKTKLFCSVKTKNLNWEISTKNLVIFKKWMRVKDEQF